GHDENGKVWPSTVQAVNEFNAILTSHAEIQNHQIKRTQPDQRNHSSRFDLRMNFIARLDKNFLQHFVFDQSVVNEQDGIHADGQCMRDAISISSGLQALCLALAG